MPSSACPPTSSSYPLSLHDALPICLYLVPFGEIQREVVLSVPPPTRVVVYRRLMVRIAEAIAHQTGALALATGESLGQVASQTLEKDRKSTRLNSSHRTISYAVFCLSAHLQLLPSFPTRRSSDLPLPGALWRDPARGRALGTAADAGGGLPSPDGAHRRGHRPPDGRAGAGDRGEPGPGRLPDARERSEEHTSELQSPYDLVCRLLLVRPPPAPTLFPYTTLFRSASTWCPLARSSARSCSRYRRRRGWWSTVA